jgi:transcription antitermination protein NusB
MGSRHEARERALSLCYELDVRGLSADEVLAGLPVPPDEYTLELVRGVESRRLELDPLIDKVAEHWTVDRMPVVDRNVLRIGLFELLDCLDVPPAVVISEAVELAKRYSTADSGRFVNGVMARLARELRPEGDDAEGDDAEGDDAEGDDAGAG